MICLIYVCIIFVKISKYFLHILSLHQISCVVRMVEPQRDPYRQTPLAKNFNLAVLPNCKCECEKPLFMSFCFPN